MAGGIRAGSVFVELSAQMDREGRQQLELYERKLKEVHEKAERRDWYRAKLGADYDPRAFNAMERDLKRAKSSSDDMVRGNARLRTSFGQLWSRGGAAFAAAGGAYAIVGAVKSVTSAYQEAQVSTEKMRAQLNALGLSYDAHAKQIDEVIQKTSQLAGLDDEDLQDAFTNIVRVTGNVTKALNLVGLAADFARAKHMDVARAGELVGKVAGGNLGILSRYGIVIDKGATATEALGLLQRKFGGQAEAYGKTQAGAIDRVNVAFENLRETLGRKLAPYITRAANDLAVFINQMQTGEGAGGDFVVAMEKLGRAALFVARVIRGLASAVAFTIDKLSGLLSGFYDMLKVVADAGSKLPFVGGKFKALSKALEESSDKVNRFREDIRTTYQPIRTVGDRLDKLSANARLNMGQIRRVTEDAMQQARTRMRVDSKQGAEAVRENFGDAMRAIRRSMSSGVTSTREGLREIRSLLSQELKFYGVKSLPGMDITAPLAKQKPLTKAGGGWVGEPGMIGQDTVPAMLAPGEAVLNRHQQAVIEGLLGGGFLDRLFATVNRPHYLNRGGRVQRFQGGGIVSVPGFPGERAAASVIPAIEMIAKRFGLILTDAYGQGHKSPGHTVTGTAADFAGPDRRMDAAVRYLVARGYTVGYDGRFGSQAWPGHGPSYVAGSNAHLHVELGSRGGALGALLEQITAPRVRGGGAVGRIVQGALNAGARGANRALSRASALPIAGGGGGGYSKAQLARLWVRAGGDPKMANLMAAIALAESGGRAGIVNDIGATGLWQIHPGGPQYKNPLTNARTAVYKLRTQGLGAWEAYTNGSYRQFLARGGRARSSVRLAPNWFLLRDAAGVPKDFVAPGQTLGPNAQKLLDFITMRQAEATLTEPVDDDVQWATAAQTFWQNIYDWTKQWGGGTARITEAATNLASARSALKSLTEPTDTLTAAGVDPDMQAMLDQANARAAALQANLTAAGNVQAAFGSSGDIGMGGYVNAYQASGGMRPIIINTLHPGDPQTLKAIAQASNSGNSLSGYVTSSRTNLGI